ncbi:NADH dehydrogenase subunit 4L (mitochondrion) [Pomacea canaliculata]|uniref:NADH-ubiquinone oxidoreductase chain 4L n=1 Tax=Pomacea canaliculata TaxID=400727 RepID=A0A068FKF0_POMCA|nr:NADH dehydrogenase subunit 4L [Pomacea canaliculata]AID68204.1 NADH dehydrogenase subunit 4L [Pomacea canaliculata]ANM47939.1 NADH dehydrogenase subunit 4L [Pomacea canaliculata]ART65973.1 NADH dehydrogenase subunit 4L [Pomacea canaliculata]
MSSYYLFMIAMTGISTGFISLMLQFKHLLNLLLSLEAITMNIFILLYSSSNMIGSSGFSALILITLSVCEASLGMSILVSMVQSHGNDYVSSFSSQKC